jgi:hypothetical protein
MQVDDIEFNLSVTLPVSRGYRSLQPIVKSVATVWRAGIRDPTSRPSLT